VQPALTKSKCGIVNVISVPLNVYSQVAAFPSGILIPSKSTNYSKQSGSKTNGGT
jgi:hypothetical protein